MCFFSLDNNHRKRQRQSRAVAVPALIAHSSPAPCDHSTMEPEQEQEPGQLPTAEIPQVPSPAAWGPHRWFDWREQLRTGAKWHQCRLCNKGATQDHLNSDLHQRRIRYPEYFLLHAAPIGEYNREQQRLYASGTQAASYSAAPRVVIVEGTLPTRPAPPPIPPTAPWQSSSSTGPPPWAPPRRSKTLPKHFRKLPRHRYGLLCEHIPRNIHF